LRRANFRLQTFALFNMQEEITSPRSVPISVVIPAYNSELYIRETLASISAQTTSVDEIIVVDNNCTDDTVAIAREMGATVIKENRQNISASRNAGIRAARNDWIALLDHDDLWAADKIKYQWEAAKLYPEARIIGCRFDNLIEADAPITNTTDQQPDTNNSEEIFRYFPAINRSFFAHYNLHTSGLIVHRTVFEEAGYYDERFSPQEDIEFMFRVLAHYPLAYVCLLLSRYRRHENNTINNLAALIAAQKLIVEEIHRQPARYIDGAKEYIAEGLKQAFVIQSRALSSEIRKKAD
jgi:glycosyltransferase involved in cell wall biosynthesis